jgi:hypothetical protein
MAAQKKKEKMGRVNDWVWRPKVEGRRPVRGEKAKKLTEHPHFLPTRWPGGRSFLGRHDACLVVAARVAVAAIESGDHSQKAW